VVDEKGEAVSDEMAGGAGVVVVLLEPFRSQEGFAQQQQRPAIAHY
jgi:hypothetical protein